MQPFNLAVFQQGTPDQPALLLYYLAEKQSGEGGEARFQQQLTELLAKLQAERAAVQAASRKRQLEPLLRTKDKMSNGEYEAKRRNLQQHAQRQRKSSLEACQKCGTEKEKSEFTSHQWRNRRAPGYPVCKSCRTTR